jgi:hypothetical protein
LRGRVVDFPENAVAIMVEAAEVVFPVRIVAFREAVERCHTLANFQGCDQPKGLNPAYHEFLAQADSYRIEAESRFTQAGCLTRRSCWWSCRS